MANSQWHKFYTAQVAARRRCYLIYSSDLPNYTNWLPGSGQFSKTTDVEPYPVQLGTRYHDGKPDGTGKDWWGTVTGFQPPGAIDSTTSSTSASSFDRENVRTMAAVKRYAELNKPAN